MSINKIKYIAIISMVCDHLASVFFAPDASIYSPYQSKDRANNGSLDVPCTR